MRGRVRSALCTAVVAVLLGSGVVATPAASTAPLFLITPTSFDFGTQPLHSPSKSATVHVTNISGVAQTMSGTGGAAGVFGGTQNCQGTTLQPGDSCAMTYAFTPARLGKVSTTATGKWNGQAFALHFSGTGTPQFRISPTRFDFGPQAVGSASAVQKVVVTNLGTSAATMNGTGGNAGVFGGMQNCQGATVAAKHSCSMSYQFAPTGLGSVHAATTGKWNGQHYALDFDGIGTGPASDDFVPMAGRRLVDKHGSHRLLARHVQTVNVPSSLVPLGSRAADLTVTAGGGAAGTMTVWPCDQKRPSLPTLVFGAHHEAADHVLAQLSPSGTVCARASAASDLRVDIDGYYPQATGYRPVRPRRVLDTGKRHRAGAGKVEKVRVAGSAATASSVSSAVNVTVSHPSGNGQLTAWPCGATPSGHHRVAVPQGRDASRLIVDEVGGGNGVPAVVSAQRHGSRPT